MAEKKIVVNIDGTGNVEAETFGMIGTECVDELDRLMKDLALSATHNRKPEFYRQKTHSDTKVENKSSK